MAIFNWDEKSISNIEINKANIPDMRISIPKNEHKVIYYRLQDGETQEQIASDYHVHRSRICERNLTLFKWAYIIGKIYNEEKQKHGGDRKSEKIKSSNQNDYSITKTHEIIAKQFNMGSATVQRYGTFAEKIDLTVKLYI